MDEQTPLRRIASDFAANPVADFGVALLAVIVATALLAPLISPQNPYDLAQLDVMDARLLPGAEYRAAARSGLAPTIRAATCCRPSSTDFASV